MIERNHDETGPAKATTGRTRRRVLAGAVATATAGTIMVLVSIGTATSANAAPQPKVTICHATPPANAKNGWNQITVSANSIIKGKGHGQHAADIIPAFDYNGGTYPGKNLDTDFGGASGREILANGCVLPDVTPTPTITDTVTPTDTVTNTATNTVTNTVTNTATNTDTNTVTNTATNTDTNTVTNTATNTDTVTNTATATDTGTVTATATESAGNAGTSVGPIPVAVEAGLHTPVASAGLKAWGIVLILIGGAAGLLAGAWPTRRRSRVH